ncbi:MAG: alpha/beta hydrolase [Erysipelotrichaceae bacterium]|nr:alpha/beta hydrolase [Erysipelotrichaceae bacterium]
MKKVWKFLKNPTGTLTLALVLILLGAILANLFHTSFYSVKITEISFETDRGTLVGYLYMPSGAGPEDPRPVIVTTHGYLNTKEMQDASAIEMARRGFIVLALDMYDHGDSRWKLPMEASGIFGTFWVYSQFDAAMYMAAQPYTLKDANGNAYLAVSGHSMGGFSTWVAVYMDELTSLTTGKRAIYAAIPQAADTLYASMIAPADQLLAAIGDRPFGVLAAHYDEFFFNKSDAEKTTAELLIKGTVVYKDYPNTLAGKQLLGLSANAKGESGKYYSVSSGELLYDGNVVRESQTGSHVIFTPTETHPWNHFSMVSTGYLISFYQTAFKSVVTPSMTNWNLSPDNQIWQYKEISNFISLIGFFLLIVPLLQLILKLPFFKLAVVDAPDYAPERKVKGAVGWVATLICMAIPAVFFSTFMDKTGLLTYFAYGAGGIAIVALLASFIYKKAGIFALFSALAAAGLAAVLYFAPKLLVLSNFFNEPTVNQIGYWALCSGLITATVTLLVYFFIKKPAGYKFSAYGTLVGIMPIVAALAAAVAAVAVAYGVLFIIQAVFGVDFRIWVLAVRTFQVEHLITALHYAPFFLVYYFFNTMSIYANNNDKKLGALWSALGNCGALALWLALQYGLLFATGVAMQPDQSLNGILLFALVPCLAIAGVYAFKLSKATNNIWVAAFTNTLLFTIITCANTAMFWNIV